MQIAMDKVLFMTASPTRRRISTDGKLMLSLVRCEYGKPSRPLLPCTICGKCSNAVPHPMKQGNGVLLLSILNAYIIASSRLAKNP